MIYATVKLRESSFYSLHELGSGVVVRQEVIYETRPMERVENGAIVDENSQVCLVLQVVFDDLLYRIELDLVAFSDARTLVEDLITTQYVGAEFDYHGRMLTMVIGGNAYAIQESELIGSPDHVEPRR